MQLIALDAPWYEPGSHSRHKPIRSCGAWLPGLHGVGSVAPVGQKLPDGHELHTELLLRLVELPKLPSSHGSGEDAPSGQ